MSSDTASLIEALERLASGLRLPEDLQELQQGLDLGRITIASNGGVAIAGDVSGGIVVGSLVLPPESLKLLQPAYQPLEPPRRDVIINLIKGVDSLSTNYAVRIQNFFSEYLGAAGSPMPFGGRDSEMKMLDAWLDDPEGPPYSLLAAPAGRGKSAFLVHWSQRLLITRKDLAIVFIPISIRFNINLANVVFAALTARLAVLYGDSPPDINNSPDILRGIISDYLSRSLSDGRKLLVILDGLDEAAGWNPGPDLFSLNPPKGLKIVASARYLAGDTDASSWLRRLGWTRPGLAIAPCLGPLTRDGVADVLKRMGFPLASLGQNIDIVSEIYRLSEGDPLLVRLYVEELWSRGESAANLRPDHLRELRPGLEGFFDRWWEDQRMQWGDKNPIREAAVRELLSLFACALGPLSRDDVMEIVASTVNLDTWMLEETLVPLKRFIIGDGVEKGYVFSHPRLGSYFLGKLGKKERTDLESRFLSWGVNTQKAANEGRIPNKGSYIVQYYGAHLERANCSADLFLPLVSNGWRIAWEAQGIAYSGFLNDIERAWKAIELEDRELIRNNNFAVHISDEICCAMCIASINSLSSNIPLPLLDLLVEKKIWTPTQGLHYAQQISVLEQRVEALSIISKYLIEAQRDDTLRSVLSMINDINNDRLRSIYLIKIGPYLTKSLINEALTIARGIGDEFRKATALINIALISDDRDNILSETRILVDRIKDPWKMLSALAQVACYSLDEKELFDEILNKANRISDEWDKARTLVEIAPFLPQSKLNNALILAKGINHRWERSWSIARMVPYLADPKEALILASEITDDSEKSRAMSEIVPRLKNSKEGLELANKIEDKSMRSKAIAGIATYLSDPNEGLFLAKGIEDKLIRSKAIADITPRLSDLKESLSLAKEIENKLIRSEAIANVAPHLSDPKEAFTAAMEIGDVLRRLNVMARAITLLKEADQETVIGMAFTLIEKIDDEDVKSRALAEIVPYLPHPDNYVIKIREIKDEAVRSTALAEIVPRLGDPERAIAVTKEISNEGEKSKALQAISRNLSEPLLKDVLSAAREIEYEWWMSNALAGIAPLLHNTNEALSVARGIMFDWEKSRALAGIVPQISNIEEAIAIAMEINNKYWSCCALVRIATRLNGTERENMLDEALHKSSEIDDEWEKLRALLEIADNIFDFDNIEKRKMLKEALTVARRINNISAKFRALVLIALHFSNPEKSNIIREALALIKEIKDERARSWAMAGIAPALDSLSLQDLYYIWCEILHCSVKNTRDLLLIDIKALLALIAKLGGDDSLIKTILVIQKICKWWP